MGKKEDEEEEEGGREGRRRRTRRERAGEEKETEENSIINKQKQCTLRTDVKSATYPHRPCRLHRNLVCTCTCRSVVK